MSNSDRIWENRNKRLISFGLNPYEFAPPRKKAKREVVMKPEEKKTWWQKFHDWLFPKCPKCGSKNLSRWGMCWDCLGRDWSEAKRQDREEKKREKIEIIKTALLELKTEGKL